MHLSVPTWEAVAADAGAVDVVGTTVASVPAVAFYGVDGGTVATLDDAYMVGYTVTTPIEEDDISRLRGVATLCPLPAILKPRDTLSLASSELGNDACFDIPTFVCAPANECGTPLNTTAKAIPAPIGLSTHVANLRGCDLNDGA